MKVPRVPRSHMTDGDCTLMMLFFIWVIYLFFS